MTWSHLLITSAALYLIIVARYFLVAGLFYYGFWVKDPERFRHRRLQKTAPKKKEIWYEIRWSLITSLIFALPGAVMIEAWKEGKSLIYTDIHLYGWWYVPFSIFVYMFIHDTYFYWTHRWMHSDQKIFRLFHKVHHNSPNPTPWAAFSFHPLESIIAAAIIPALVFMIPIHVGALLFVLTAMTILSVTNHTGYEVLPLRWVRSGVGAHLISATHHNRHHTHYTCNYGLYFRWWDKWMGTDQMSPAPGHLGKNSAL